MNKLKMILLSLPFFFNSCGKKNNVTQSSTLYNQALHELSGEQGGEHATRRALARLDEALTLDESPRTLALKATLLAQLALYEQSNECFTRALAAATDPTMHDEIVNNQACLFAMQGKHEEALRAWDDLLRSEHYLTPEVVLYNQARVRCEQARFQDARQLLGKATAQAPEYVDAHFFGAIVALRCGDTAGARQSVQTTLALAPEHSAARALAAQLSVNV